MMAQAHAAAKRIQEWFRKCYHRNYKQNSELRIFHETKSAIMGGLSALENGLLFGGKVVAGPATESVKLKEVAPDLYKRLAEITENHEKTAVERHLKPISPYSPQKIYAFTVVLDVHLLVYPFTCHLS